MKIYLASGFRHRFVLRGVADSLVEMGHKVVSSWIWIDERPERNSVLYEAFAKRVAARNRFDLVNADVVIVDAWGISKENHGGVHTEFGFALGAGKGVYVVGPRANTFHWLPEVTQFPDWKFLFEQWRV